MLERLVRRLTRSVLLWDLGLTLLCLYSATQLWNWASFGKELAHGQTQLPWLLYLAVALTWGVIFVLLTPQRALFFSSLLDAIGRLLAAVGLGVFTFAGLLYLSFREWSRLQFLYFALSDVLVLLVLHLLVYFYTHRAGRVQWRRVLLVGGGVQAQQLIYEFNRRPWTGVQVIGYTSDEPMAADLPLLGSIAATAQIVTEHAIDEVIFVMDQQEQIAQISVELQQYPVMLHMVPSLLDLAFPRTPIAALGGIPLISLCESALSEPQRVLKRLFDIGSSTALLLLLSPIMVLIALLIKLDSPGPVFFWQERIGEHGQRFKMIKFRSMYRDADRQWQAVARRDAAGNLQHKQDNDPRVTSLGRKLRRTSLDELPQLINVLRGEMSLVGPRPEMPYMTAEYDSWQWQRFRVPPGMTGWWQVNGRSGRPMHLNTEDDLYYIHNYSFWLDLKILWMTIGVVVRGQGAF